MYVKSIQIENLRCFKQAELELQYPGRKQAETPRLPNINLLLGNNGMGKTTILKALAMAALSPIFPQAGYYPYRLVRRTGPDDASISEASISASVLLHAQDLGVDDLPTPLEERLEMRIGRRGDDDYLKSEPGTGPDAPEVWERMFDKGSPAFLVVGYGASRRVEESKNVDKGARRSRRQVRYGRVAGLFEGDVSLIPLGSWLPDFEHENPGRYRQVVNLVSRLLPDGAEFEGRHEEGEYLFKIYGLDIPYPALSDGYRAYIGWITDLIYHVCMGAPSGAKLVDNCGLVLVDEIDLHLHPEWQRSVTATISQALPRLQFVFSSHSPIVAGSLNKENIYVMEQEESGASTVRQYGERIYGLDAEQVLLSSYFGLKTTRAKPVEDELWALSAEAGRGSFAAALALMGKLSGDTSPSESPGGPEGDPLSFLGEAALPTRPAYEREPVVRGGGGGRAKAIAPKARRDAARASRKAGSKKGAAKASGKKSSGKK